MELRLPEHVFQSAILGQIKLNAAVEALDRQEPFINQALPYQALATLAVLFRCGRVSYHGGFISLADGCMSPIDIRSDRHTKKTVHLVWLFGEEFFQNARLSLLQTPESRAYISRGDFWKAEP
jgi:hypothetical protein